MARNRPVHFEIHADDPLRAVKFYTNVFGWNITKWDNPAMEYWVVMTGKAESGDPSTGSGQEKWPGIDGGLLRRKGPRPAADAPVNGYVNTMTVPNFDDTASKISANGGEVALPKFDLAGMGWLGYFKDTEGNIFGVMEEVKRK